MRQGEPFRPTMFDRGPEFTRTIPHRGLLLIDPAEQKIVRARLIRSMMKANGPLRRFLLLGVCHDERFTFSESSRPSRLSFDGT